MAGISQTAVVRMRRAFGLHPNRAKTFKLSNDGCSSRRCATSCTCTSSAGDGLGALRGCTALPAWLASSTTPAGCDPGPESGSSHAGVGRLLQDALPEYWAALNGKAPWLLPQTVEVVRETPGGKAHERVRVHPLKTGACIIVVDESRLRELELAHRQMGRLASMGFMLVS